jgi:hypothetical protein
MGNSTIADRDMLPLSGWIRRILCAPVSAM